MFFKNKRAEVAVWSLVAIVAIVAIAGMVFMANDKSGATGYAAGGTTKIFDTGTGQEIGESLEVGGCRYIGQNKLLCPAIPAETTKACLGAALASCEDDMCVLGATQTCVSEIGNTPLNSVIMGPSGNFVFFAKENANEPCPTVHNARMIVAAGPSTSEATGCTNPDQCFANAENCILDNAQLNGASFIRSVMVAGKDTVADTFGWHAQGIDLSPGDKLNGYCKQNLDGSWNCAEWSCKMKLDLNGQWDINPPTNATHRLCLYYIDANWQM